MNQIKEKILGSTVDANKRIGFKKSLELMPIGFSGLGLGVSGLGNAYSALLNNPRTLMFDKIDPTYWNPERFSALAISAVVVQAVTTLITLFCFLLILVRMFCHHRVFWKEVKDPLLSSFVPTEAMCLASIANFIGVISTFGASRTDHILNAGTIIACILIVMSLAFHSFLFGAFLWFVIKRHNICEDVTYASWFVPTCGIALSCSFYPNLGNLIPNEFFQFFWYLGFTGYFGLFPLIFYKHLFFKQLGSERIATAAIFLAAPNLLLNGLANLFTNYSKTNYYPPYYLSSSGQPYYIFALSVIIMFFCILGTIVFFALLFKVFRTKFNPLFASLTFPSSVAALATLKFSQSILGTFVSNAGGNQIITVPDQNFFKLDDRTSDGLIYVMHKTGMFFGFVFLMIASMIIIWIIVRYVMIFVSKINIKNHQYKKN